MHFSVVDVIVSDSLRNCNQFAKTIGTCWATHRSASVAVENKKRTYSRSIGPTRRKKTKRLSVLVLKKMRYTPRSDIIFVATHDDVMCGSLRMLSVTGD